MFTPNHKYPQGRLMLLALALLFLWPGCRDWKPEKIFQDLSTIDQEITPNGASVSLEGVGSVLFPPGAFAESNTVRISKTLNQELDEHFDLARVLYNVRQITDYEVQINTGASPVQAASVRVELEVPTKLSGSLSSGELPKVFALLNPSHEEDAPLEYFLIPSEYEEFSGMLLFDLPNYFFSDKLNNSNARSSAESYQANLVIGVAEGREGQVQIPGNASACLGEYLLCPLEDCLSIRVSSGFGPRVAPTTGASSLHPGVDLAVPVGTPVYAVAGGTVAISRCDSKGCEKGYGHFIVIKHDRSKSNSLYAHLSRKMVRVGERVEAGQLIGYSGQSGIGTGPHLHFGYYANGRLFEYDGAADPLPCFNEEDIRLIGIEATIPGVNDCEHVQGAAYSGTSWYVTLDYFDPKDQIGNQSVLTFECLNCTWQTNGSKILHLPSSGISPADGTVVAPDFCARWGNTDVFNIGISLTTPDGRTSNAVYIDLPKPPGAYKREGTNPEGEGPFKGF